MNIIGIHNTGVTSAACLVSNGQIKYAFCEERLNRNKYSKYFPILSIKKCLNCSNLTFKDIDYFAIAWNPGINIKEKLRPGFSEWPAYPGQRLYANPNNILNNFDKLKSEYTEQTFSNKLGKDINFLYVNHHICHAATSFYLSNLNNAAIFSCDSYGEKSSTMWGIGNKGKIKVIKEISFPHSLGQFYSMMTEFLGFKPNFDEWKVMGASAYGNWKSNYKKIRQLINFEKDGEFSLDLKYFDHFNFDTKNMFSKELINHLNLKPRKENEKIKKIHFDLAATIQKITEECVMHSLKWLKKETKKENLCLTGGLFMNSVINGIVSKDKTFKKVYIPYAPDDSGNAIGAALWTYYQKNKIKKNKIKTTPFLGYKYTEKEILNTLKKYKIKFKKTKNLANEVANLISNGELVGWFQGKMEFGQRALGCRSILADPRKKNMKDIVNKAVKFREGFRPFAPSVIQNSVSDFFEINNDMNSPYMEKVFKIKNNKRSVIPAVTHFDGSGRLQTVDKFSNPLFYDLIYEFNKLTNVPVLLNTSFNTSGEPIVESPADAIKTFFSSGLTILAIGPYIIKK